MNIRGQHFGTGRLEKGRGRRPWLDSTLDGSMERHFGNFTQARQAGRQGDTVDQLDRIAKPGQALHGGTKLVRRQIPQECLGRGKTDAAKLLHPDLPALKAGIAEPEIWGINGRAGIDPGPACRAGAAGSGRPAGADHGRTQAALRCFIGKAGADDA